VIGEAVAAIRAGEPVVLPTDTVYGLCASPHTPEPTQRLYRLKGREDGKPTAILAADLDALFALLPELDDRSRGIARALLPGPFTLVLPNPARRFGWLTGSNPEAIGIRVPELPDPARAVLEAVGAVLATSANLPGGPDPRTLAEVPESIRAGAAALVDAGALPGTPSTVLDATGTEPRVLREGAVPAGETLERLRAALGSP
jgi:L-threonylcarbamoyladenylate synthase